jgi:hypothetical protein
MTKIVEAHLRKFATPQSLLQSMAILFGAAMMSVPVAVCDKTPLTPMSACNLRSTFETLHDSCIKL